MKYKQRLIDVFSRGQTFVTQEQPQAIARPFRVLLSDLPGQHWFEALMSHKIACKTMSQEQVSCFLCSIRFDTKASSGLKTRGLRAS